MKLIRSLVVLFITLILLTGCFKRDNMDDISIAVTKYPIEYLVKNILLEVTLILILYQKNK